MPLSISLRHEDARANKRYRLSEDQFKKIALYDGLIQDDNIYIYMSNLSAGATMSFDLNKAGLFSASQHRLPRHISLCLV